MYPFDPIPTGTFCSTPLNMTRYTGADPDVPTIFPASAAFMINFGISAGFIPLFKKSPSWRVIAGEPERVIDAVRDLHIGSRRPFARNKLRLCLVRRNPVEAIECVLEAIDMQDIVFGNCASHRDPGERRQQGQAFEIVIDTLPPGVCLLHELGNRGGSCDVATQFRHVGKECLIGLLLLVDHRIDPPGHNAQDQRSAGGDVLLRQPGLCRGKPLSAKRPFTAFSNPPTLSLFWQDNAKGLVTSSTASLPMSSWPPSIRIVSTGKHDEAPDAALSDEEPANVWIVRAGSCDAATPGTAWPAFAATGLRSVCAQ